MTTIVEVSDEQILRALLAEEDVSNRAVAQRLGISDRRVDEVRKRAGLPSYVRGRRAAYRSWEEAFTQQSEPVDGGHRRWTGPREKSGTPVVRYRTAIQTAYRVAFRLHNGREPEGYVTRSCKIPGCVAGEHQQDRIMREAAKAGEAA
ncbi:winged helix-turn-helix domain-containing protein [Streptomyces canus]|uniref:winged helix-turn-helix domain-containing protein n=1 Tax=Streptomyces canus TaxID=58343 RepID=UPI00277F3CE8|nr:winged helix-turn-helix domain-containing protein [Streptomyces canus]MDQ0762064.1 hypothetical protein [Streptomyces canus]